MQKKVNSIEANELVDSLTSGINTSPSDLADALRKHDPNEAIEALVKDPYAVACTVAIFQGIDASLGPMSVLLDETFVEGIVAACTAIYMFGVEAGKRSLADAT